jgi:hypothetical protein
LLVAKAYEILISIFCPGGKSVLDFPGSGPGMVEACITCQRQIFVGVPGSMEVPDYADVLSKIVAANLPQLSSQHIQQWESLQGSQRYGISVASYSATKQTRSTSSRKSGCSEPDAVHELEEESESQEEELDPQQSGDEGSDEDNDEEGGAGSEGVANEKAKQPVEKVHTESPPASGSHKRTVPKVSELPSMKRKIVGRGGKVKRGKK